MRTQAPYNVEIAPAAQRQIKKLIKRVQDRIIARIHQLSDEPRPPGMEKLKGVENLYRIRDGDYRIIYKIQDQALIITVVKVSNRREVYRNL